ncbi:MAG: ATP-binding protein [Pseudomonadota bacterium]|nr:MAG: hypothetical protein DIU74_02350 [Pseudomonadota bacterium]
MEPASASPDPQAAQAFFAYWEWTPATGQVNWRPNAPWRATVDDFQSLLALVDESVRADLAAALRSIAANGGSFARDYPAATGGVLQVCAAAAGQDAARTVWGMVQDLTRARAEEAALRRAADTARADFDAFAYAVSHDLRAPLRAIGGFSEVLLESEPGTLEANARQYLPRIVAATRRMSQLLDDLLQLARLNRAEMRPDWVDLAALGREIAARLDAQSERAVQFDAPAELNAWGDPKLLEALLQHLLHNAWKFTRRAAAPRVELGGVRENGALRCYVRDNGVGFDPEYGDKLFQPLQRLHRAEDFEGSGVGLSVVKRIVERHSGEVGASGAENQGATFWFRLPLS